MGILYNLYGMLIYIYDTFSTNMGEIRVKISYEPLLEGIFGYAEHVTNYFAVFSERGGQMF